MPGGLTRAEQILYLQLRMLYHQFRMGVIDRATAVSEKKKFIIQYERNVADDKYLSRRLEIIRQTELARAKYRKNRTLENADALLHIIDGITKEA